MTNTARIGGLGEVALSVTDLDTMARFYEDKVGLTLLRRFPESAFFKIADGFAGHTQILALFDCKGAPSHAHTTLDHLAFAIDRADYDHEQARLQANGLTVQTVTFAWVKWRSLFITDPEGNRIEFVCFDPSVE